MDWDALPGLKARPKLRQAEAIDQPVEEKTDRPFIDGFSFEQLIGTSEHDILLQLFRERKISKVMLFAGRQWQHYMEEASLQPCMSIDPGVPLSRDNWQCRGDITEAQYRAIIIRRIASGALAKWEMRLLDRIFQPDIGRADAVLITRMPRDRLSNILNRLLLGLAIYFDYSTGDTEDGLDAFREANVKKTDYRIQWTEGKIESGTLSTVSGLIRHMNGIDTKVMRP